MKKILDLYYLIPYDYRPKEIWYALKCFTWHRYTTTKPRYLSHKWHDKVDVLPHTMFEILSNFIENECSPGNVDWYYEEWQHTIKVNGVNRNVRDEMQALYDWWHEKYNKHYNEILDGIYESLEIEEFCMPLSKKTKRAYNLINRIDSRIDKELEENMIRLIKLRPYLWT